jgi:hypothetical protein
MPNLSAELSSKWFVINCPDGGLAGTSIRISKDDTTDKVMQICGVRVFGTQTGTDPYEELGIGA